MKSTYNRLFVALFSITMSLCFTNCSGSGESASNKYNTKNKDNTKKEAVASDDFNKMMKQLDKAIANGNFAFAFEVINSIPSHFDDYSRFYYDPKTGEMGEYEDDRTKYSHEQYCRKAVSMLKAESDVLLSKNDPEAESLFLEHLADFDLGVNNVYIGKFFRYDDKSNTNERYQDAVTIYNDYLISVVRKALVKGNPELAKKVSLLIRDGLSFTEVHNDYDWDYDTEAKDEAQEIISNFNAY